LNDWYILPATEPSSELLEQVGGHPLVARLLTQRGFDTMEKARPFLDPEHYTPAPPTDLIGVAEAALHLYQAINQKQKILVWGDFDVDGQTRTQSGSSFGSMMISGGPIFYLLVTLALLKPPR